MNQLNYKSRNYINGVLPLARHIENNKSTMHTDWRTYRYTDKDEILTYDQIWFVDSGFECNNIMAYEMDLNYNVKYNKVFGYGIGSIYGYFRDIASDYGIIKIKSHGINVTQYVK